MKRAAAAIALCVVAACRPDAAGPGRFHATVATPSGDTVRVSLPLVGQPCAGAGGILLRGIDGAQGVLIWVSAPGSPDTGGYAIHDAAADVAGPHARVTVRYETGGMVHAMALDSGTVRLAETSPIAGSLGGSGLALGAGQRPLVQGTFRAAPIRADTVGCRADTAQGS